MAHPKTETVVDNQSIEWVPAACRPKGNIHCVLTMNDSEFAISIGTIDGDHSTNQIFKYNVQHDEWSLIVEIPTTGNIFDFSMVIDHYDRGTNQLYMSSAEIQMMVDLHSASIVQKSFDHDADNGMADITHGVPSYVQRCCAGMVSVNGTVHKVGGLGNSEHVIWNKKQQLWESTNAIQPFKKFGELTQISESLVHVTSKNIILMIGGKAINCAHGPVGIWRFNISKRGPWEQIDECQVGRFDLSECSTALSADERYVLIMGGQNLFEKRLIHFLDISDDDEYKLFRSFIQPPKVRNSALYPHHMAISRDIWKAQLLTSGWMRWVFEDTEIFGTILPPLDIMNEVSKYWSVEMVHWIDPSFLEMSTMSLSHQVIPLAHILSHSVQTLCCNDNSDCPDIDRCQSCQLMFQNQKRPFVI